MSGTRSWVRGVGWTVLALTAAGCAQERPLPSEPPVARAPVEPPRASALPLPNPPLVVQHSPLVEQRSAALVAGMVVDARVLVISAAGTEPELAAVRQTLAYLGTPYDLMIATQAPTLTASQLGTSTHGRYSGVILMTGNLAYFSGGQWLSAFSSAEWQTLATYEANFMVRRAALYAWPDAGYGFSGTASQDTAATPLHTSCTTAGRAVFPYVNCSVGVTVAGVWSYPATPLDSSTIPLLVDGAGRVLAATRAYADGREALVLTFGQAAARIHSLQLLHGVVSWVNRGVFLGERHAYIGVQVDDFLLANDLYTGGTYRMTASDLEAVLEHQQAKQSNPTTAGLVYNFAFNGAGAVIYAPDALAARAQQLVPAFYYINHSYDHASFDPLSYAQTWDELSRNLVVASQYGLQPFSIANLVTPGITGLSNPNAMRAAADFGVRYLVSDTSIPGQDNPTPNAGIINSLEPRILMIPRRPTNLFYNVSTPAQWVAEYNAFYRSYWGRDLNYDEILDHESDVLVQYLLKGENDPWMFHQADLREYAAGHTLLGDLLDATFAKYASYVTTPLVGPTMEVLGQRVADRMRYDASGASGTIDPVAGNVTVRAVNAATVPVTGACPANVESYAGQAIGYVPLAAGASATVPTCPSGTGGTGGTGGGGGTGGTGGTTFSLPCSTLTVAAGSIGGGQTAAALTDAVLTGTEDVWDEYVEVFPSSSIVCSYLLPAGVSPSSVSSLALQVNYRGPDRAYMRWTFEVRDVSSSSWLLLGDNSFAEVWVWTPHTFTVPAPLTRFFSGGALQIRYQTTSNLDASDIDQLLITGTR